MKKERRWPSILFGIVLALLPFLMYLGIMQTNSLFLQWLLIFYVDTFLLVAIAFFIFHDIERDKSHKEKRRHFGFFTIGAVLFMLLINLLPVFGISKPVRLNGRKPMGLTYKTALLRDAFEKETVTCTIPREEWEDKLGVLHYTIKISKRRHSGTNNFTFYFLSYTDGEKENRVLLPSLDAYMYVQKKNQAEAEEIVIEYYKHSGALKSLDGINLSDSAALKEKTAQLAEEVKLAVSLKKSKNANASKTMQAVLQSLYTVMNKATGLSWAAVEKELTDLLALPEAPTGFKYRTEYIRTLHFEPGTVAFVDVANRLFYVVLDHSDEEMVQVPYFGENETAETIRTLFNDAGVSFRLYVDTTKPLSEQIIRYCGEPSGTYVPKDYSVVLAINE